MEGVLDHSLDEIIAGGSVGTAGGTLTSAEVQRLLEELAWLRQKVSQQDEEIERLKLEVERFKRENLELRQQAGYWKGMHARAVEREKTLGKQVEQLQGEVRKLQAEQFGKRSEKQTRKDRSNTLDDHETQPAPKRKRGQQPKNPAPKRRDYSHLPKRTQVIELPEEQRCCPVCGEAFTKMSDAEVTEQIEIEVTAYRQELVRNRYRRKCDCGECAQTVTAPAPAKLIPKGRFGTSVWVEILLDKFYGHCSTGRLIERLRLLGLHLAPGTITGGMKKLEPLFTPIYEALCQRQASSDYYQADETRWLMFTDEQGRTGRRWWLWLFAGEDTCVFRLDPTRSHDVPEGHFAPDAKGVLMVDRYASYKAMAQVKAGTLKLAFCWAHVRRDFVKVGKGWPELKDWALVWLDRIRQLYRLNRERLRQDADSDAYCDTDAKLRDHAEQMRLQRDMELALDNIREPVRKTLESLSEHWEGLTLFVDDPLIPMDNNASERGVRGPATGRKNYYGSGAEWCGRLAAMLFSIFATLRQWHINPRAWLTWYLQACTAAPGQTPDDIEPFLPWNLSDACRAQLNAHPQPDSFDTS